MSLQQQPQVTSTATTTNIPSTTNTSSTDLTSFLDSLITKGKIRQEDKQQLLQYLTLFNTTLDDILGYSEKDLEDTLAGAVLPPPVRGNIKNVLNQIKQSINSQPGSILSTKKRKYESTENTRELLYPKQIDKDFITVGELVTAKISLKNETIFYLRPSAKELLNFLNDNDFVLVDGCSGTGKSSVVWIWACNVALTRPLTKICWLHIDKLDSSYCLLGNSTISSGLVENEKKFINACDCQILIFDGVVAAQQETMKAASIWRKKGVNRKLILVSSQQIIIFIELQKRENVKPFVMPSWTLEDYEIAISNEEFFESVKYSFPIDSQNPLMQKYFYAGSSARWMFSMIIDDIISSAKLHMSSISNIDLLICGFSGNRSDIAVNHLMFTDSKSESGFIVSEYVFLELAKKFSREFIYQATNSELAKKNPAFDRWIMEADFIMQVETTKPVVLIDYQKPADLKALYPAIKKWKK